MKKRIFSLFLAICMIVSLMTGITLTVSAETSGTCGENLTWTLDDGKLTISGTGAMKSWYSSSRVPWYSEREDIVNVTIESGVTSIGKYAFRDCLSLTSITIPDSVTIIGDSAFSGCSSLTNIIISDSVTIIGDSVFSGCSSLANITIPDSVTSIYAYAFSGCSSLTSVTIGDSVTSIGEWAFYGCSKLTSITIPSSVTSIGRCAFEGCLSLKSITVDSNNENYSSLDGNLFNKNKTELIQYAVAKQDGHYTIPDSVTSIAWRAFEGCESLTSVIIPGSMTSISWRAFEGCESLTSVIIHGSVTYIGDYAFLNCNSLTSVTIPDSVTYIGDYAFSSCNGLISVTVGGGVTHIDISVFSYCSSLANITIPDSVTSIYAYAFSGCSSLKDVYYTGSEEQWGEIRIDSGNDYLTNATIHYDYVPTDTSGTISFNKDENTITVESTVEIPKAELLVVLYKDGEMVEMKPQTVSVAKGENTYESPIKDYTNSDTVKIMIWNSEWGMKPLFEGCSVK